MTDDPLASTAFERYQAAWDCALESILRVTPANAELIRKQQADFARAQAQRQESVGPR